MAIFNDWYNVSATHFHSLLSMGNFMKVVPCVSAAYKVVHDCQKSEKHWVKSSWGQVAFHLLTFIMCMLIH